MTDAIKLGNAAKKKNAENYREIVKALVPIAQRLAGIFSEEGITASTVRRHALRLNIINEKTPLHFLSSVMKQAGLRTSGVTRPSSIPATKGRRQLVYYADSPYAG
jgi:hypothetical protein